MSGFTRSTRRYGDQLVYEALESKWSRYHVRHCGCELPWLDHAVAAGFKAIIRSGYVVLTGPGLTEGVDESSLTTDALWKAVTGKPGSQGWSEPVRVMD